MIHVITASHNRHEITVKFAKQLKEQTYKNIHFILVDDGSTDGTAEGVEKVFENLTIIRGNGNLWWGGSLDKAFHWIKNNISTNDYVLISNDDVVYQSDYIEKGINLLADKEKVLLSGLGYSQSTGELFDTPIIWDCTIAEGKQAINLPRTGNCSSTRSLFFRVDDFKNIGGFHPILLPHYASDYEWTIRACNKGYTIISDENLKYKLDDRTTGNRDRKKIQFKKIFSKKSNMNPFYRVSFIFMTTPSKYIIKAFKRQVIRLRNE